MIRFFLLVLVIFSITENVFSQQNGVDEYVCMPCGRDCDKKVYDKPGRCSHCMMERVKKSNVIFKNIQPEELCDYIEKNPAVVLLDVRSKKEFQEKASPNYGTIKNAINIPIQELDSRLSELIAFKDKTILVYCSHSQRSSQGSYLLTLNGFHSVINMAGGLSVLKDSSCKK